MTVQQTLKEPVNENQWVKETKTLNWKDLSKACVKGLLITMNLLCIATALTTFCFAVVDTRILKQYGEERASGSLAGDMVIIAVCVLLVGIALLGCVGAVLNRVRILNAYVIAIMILVILELQVAIFVSVKRYGLQYKVSEWLQQDFYSNATRTRVEQREHESFWDNLQTEYSCCGLNGPEDYVSIRKPIRVSCCSKAYKAKSPTAQRIMYHTCLEYATYYKIGCEDELLYAFNVAADTFFTVIVFCFWFEAIGMLLAMWVANQVKNSVEVYKNTVKY